MADAAHELRSPLTALSLQAEHLAAADMSPQARERLARLGQGLNRARDLLAQLLALARAQANPREDMRAESLSLLLRQILEDMMPLAEARNIDLGVLSLDEATIQTPPHALAVILKNLLDNAIRYTPPGGRVDISASCADESVILVITDTGPGIPPAERERVFEPFYRLPGHDVTGSGPGLAIAKTLATHLGGTIHLTDAAGHRTFSDALAPCMTDSHFRDELRHRKSRRPSSFRPYCFSLHPRFQQPYGCRMATADW